MQSDYSFRFTARLSVTYSLILHFAIDPPSFLLLYCSVPSFPLLELTG